MKPTNKLRFVDRAYTYETTDRITNRSVKAIGTHRILQQWWEGFNSNQAINYAHPDAYKLERNLPGEWRDVSTEIES